MGDYALRKALVDQLKAAGLNAGTAAANVNPPGILVNSSAKVTTLGKLCSTEVLRATVVLVARASGDDNAQIQLDDLYEAVVPVLGSTLTADERPYGFIVLPDSPARLPALSLTVLLR